MTWRWPWVSRALYALACVERDAARDAGRISVEMWAKEAERWRTAHEGLLARYHMLKLQGFTEVQPVQPREGPPVDPIARAIRAKAGSDRKLREQMEAQAAKDKADGASDGEILMRIQFGVSGDELLEYGAR